MQPRAYHILLLLLSILLMGACTKELTMPDIESQSKVTLIGEFVAGQKIEFRCGQSVPINSKNSLQFKILQGLNLTAQDDWQNTYNFVFDVDTLTNVLFTLPVSCAGIAYPGNTYHLKGTHPQLQKIEADIFVPRYFDCTLRDTATVNFAATPLLRLDIEINDDGGSNNFYCLEAVKQLYTVKGSFLFQGQWWDRRTSKILFDSLVANGAAPPEKYDTLQRQQFIRLPVYTDDPNSDNLAIGNPLNVNKRILLKDKNFQGQSQYTTHLFVDTKSFISTKENEKGMVLIRIKSVAEDYFNFLKTYEQYDAQQGLNSFDKPIKITGNIRGGTGMLGGVYLHEYPFLFDKWTF